MRRPFTLVSNDGSSDTEKCVDELSEGVKSGKLIGLAYVAIYAQRNYEAHLCGEADRSPTFALGATNVLAAKLLRRIHGS